MTVSLPPVLDRCIHRGDSANTAVLMMAMTPEQRRVLMPAFKAVLRTGGFGPEVGPLLIAGAATLSTPAQVAAWMGRSQLRFFFGPYEPIMSVLADRDEAWLSELGTRLAEAIPSDGSGHWHLASTLIELTGRPCQPMTRSCVNGSVTTSKAWKVRRRRHCGLIRSCRPCCHGSSRSTGSACFSSDGTGSGMATHLRPQRSPLPWWPSQIKEP